jgi:hypothetical protein
MLQVAGPGRAYGGCFEAGSSVIRAAVVAAAGIAVLAQASVASMGFCESNELLAALPAAPGCWQARMCDVVVCTHGGVL